MTNKTRKGDAPVIRKYPTRLAVRCPQCGHQGVVMTFIDKPPNLRCSKCGNRNPVITDRDRTRAWSAQRRGK